MEIESLGVNEGLVINESIHVTVLDIREDHVRLSISSPNHRPSYREYTLCWENAEQAAELQMQY